MKQLSPITSTLEGQMNFSRTVPENEKSPVRLKIEPLSKASDPSMRMDAKHRSSRKLTVLGRITLRNKVLANANFSMRSNPDPSSNVTQASAAQTSKHDS
jgi:hypothetical protein